LQGGGEKGVESVKKGMGALMKTKRKTKEEG
jgi:hypothetical protein